MYTTCSELVVFMYWTGKSMNNLLSYYGLVDPRISASNKDLPALILCPSDVPYSPNQFGTFLLFLTARYVALEDTAKMQP